MTCVPTWRNDAIFHAVTSGCSGPRPQSRSQSARARLHPATHSSAEQLVSSPSSPSFSFGSSNSRSAANGGQSLRRCGGWKGIGDRHNGPVVTGPDVDLASVQKPDFEEAMRCYRLLGSFDDAEDHVQEVFLRAWRSRDSFQSRS